MPHMPANSCSRNITPQSEELAEGRRGNEIVKLTSRGISSSQKLVLQVSIPKCNQTFQTSTPPKKSPLIICFERENTTKIKVR